MKHYDIYGKCEECGEESWWETFDDIYAVGDTDTDFCSTCKKTTLFRVNEIDEEEWGEDD